CFELAGNDNSQVLKALKRIEGESDDDCTLARSCYTPPLSFNAPVGDAGQTVADSIAQTILFDSIQSFAHTTLWGKLIGYTSMFGAAVIPLVDKALVVPFVPGIRKTFCKSIETCDYSYVNMSQHISELLRGVALMGTSELATNAVPTSTR